MKVLTLSDLQATYNKWQREDDKMSLAGERRFIVSPEGDELHHRRISAEQVKSLSGADLVGCRNVEGARGLCQVGSARNGKSEIFRVLPDLLGLDM